MTLQARHIQNFSEATTLEPHWGYEDRALPCTNDAGSCAYLDVVYHSHDLGMLYIGIFWATIAAVLLVWGLLARSAFAAPPTAPPLEDREHLVQGSSRQNRSVAALGASVRRWLLPDGPRSLFGRTTRLQVTILAVLAGYLLVFSFAGITYNTWITPVKASPGVYNTRTSLGPWSDRIGVLAYGLTPLSVLLSSRESILSLITGVPYHHFNFLHRWLGYIILIQGLLHTIGWTIVEAKLYQPQPSVAREWIKQTYMVWGCVAIILLVALWALSLPVVVRRTGYEFFRKAHYVLAMAYIGACWGHWSHLKCFLLPSLLIWFLDRGVRLVRTLLLHHHLLPSGRMGFQASPARLTLFDDDVNSDVMRLDFEHPHQPWQVGQHFFLCFTEGSIWQSHPFTPLSHPHASPAGLTRHSYLFRAKGGETKRIAELAKQKLAATSAPTTGVILTGPYGRSIVEGLDADTNVLCVAGGTGITFVLPVLLHLVRSLAPKGRRVQLVWVVRYGRDARWVEAELDELRQSGIVSIRICPTREAGFASSGDIAEDPSEAHEKVASKDVSDFQPATAVSEPYSRRPTLLSVVDDFIGDVSAGATTVYTSGPGSMLSDMRQAVAAANSPSKVWKGDVRSSVKLVYDDRLEW